MSVTEISIPAVVPVVIGGTVRFIANIRRSTHELKQTSGVTSGRLIRLGRLIPTSANRKPAGNFTYAR